MNALVISNMTATRMSVIAARTDSTLLAGAKAIMIEQLKKELRRGVAHFLYMKKNGKLREAFGTTNRAVAAKYTNGNGCRRELFCTTAYFDVEAGEWRSFRWENLVKIL